MIGTPGVDFEITNATPKLDEGPIYCLHDVCQLLCLSMYEGINIHMGPPREACRWLDRSKRRARRLVSQ